MTHLKKNEWLHTKKKMCKTNDKNEIHWQPHCLKIEKEEKQMFV